MTCVKELELSGRSKQLSERSAAAHASELPPHALGQARALMSLHAQLDEELDFREGDIITIVGIPEPGWFQGELEGRTGIFPEGFVDLLSPLRSPQHDLDAPNLEQYQCCEMEEEEERGEEEEEEEEKVKDNLEMETQQHQEEEDEEEGSVYGVALYEFRALEPGELDFDVGDRIRILTTLEDGWLEGQLRDRRGIFPHRFVKVEKQLQTVPQIQVQSEDSGTSEKPDMDSYTSEYSLGQQDHTVPEYGQEFATHEDHTVWDLDYFERREEIREGALKEEQPKTSSQEQKVAPSRPQPQPGPRRRERPPPPLIQPKRAGSTAHGSLQRTNSGSPTPARPQLPPRPSLHVLSNRQHRNGTRSVTPDPPPVPSTRSVHPPGRTSQHLQGNSSWTRNKGHYASYDSRIPFTSRGSSGQTEKNRQKKLTRHASVNESDLESSGHRDHWSWSHRQGTNGLSASQTLDSLTSGEGLEAKLSQQLLEFEQSLPGNSGGFKEQSRMEAFDDELGKKVSRHFSILDYSSESDIIRGSSHSSADHALPHSTSHSGYISSLERQKSLRPPPPRPRILRPPPPPGAPLTNGRAAPQPYRPTRRAPRPPPPCPRPNSDTLHPSTQSSNVLFAAEEEEVPQGEAEEVEEAEDALEREREMEQEREREQEQYRLLLRLEEVERYIETYTHTAQELQAMLEEVDEEDETARQQALENLEFCTYTLETLTLEQQQLRGKLWQ